MKIAVYIDNQDIANVNLSDLSCGNPGIGGTEYSILLFAQCYKEMYPEDMVYLYASKSGILPKTDRLVVCTMIEMLDDIVAENMDILLVSARNRGIELTDEFLNEVTRRRIKTITWGHNFYYNDFCNKVAECDAIRANVFVGRQQYDRYIDHKIADKSTFIYNIYPGIKDRRINCESNVVTYIGSIVPAKGFHILAVAWKDILKEVPDASLYIIGSGILYSRNSKLGKYKIAEEKYENQFMKYLVDDNGDILPSVHFLGVLGSEKVEIIKKTKVGIVNPTGRTETFGISALDFESVGVPVVTIKKGGFLDTVIHKKTGLLYRNPKRITRKVIKLLKNKELNICYGNYAKEYALKFQPQKIICLWHDLFVSINRDEPIRYQAPQNFFFHNWKWVRIINRGIKKILHMEYMFSVIGFESGVRSILFKIKGFLKGSRE